MVSVIIPTYNRERFLRHAVQSVLNQSFQDWELIIVDDGSTDGTAELVKTFRDSRIRYFYQSRQGVSAARNRGIRESDRPWLAFLDSDDRWEPGKLERQLEVLLDAPEFRIVYTDEIWIRNGRRVNQARRHRKFSGWIYHRCLPLCIISPSSIFIERTILERERGFDETLPVCEDYDLWLRITAQYPVLFLPEPLIVKYGGHSDQLSRSRWGLDRFRIRSMLNIYGSGLLTPQQKSWTASEIARKSDILAQGYRNRGKVREASGFFRIVSYWRDLARTGSCHRLKFQISSFGTGIVISSRASASVLP